MLVRCWTIPLEQPRQIVARLAATLDERESGAATQRRATARDRYVVAHGAMRAILGDVLGDAPERITFDRRCAHCGDAEHGKPVIADAPSFSLSHSGSVAAFAVAPVRVGIDIEAVRPRVHLERLARRVLDEPEFAQWAATPDAAQLDTFLRAWTAKEAYLKAVGLGLVRPLRTVPASPAGWTIETYAPIPDTVAAVAVEERGAVGVDVATWAPDAGISLSA